MKLGFRVLDQVQDVNHLKKVETLEIVRGNATTLYLQLVSIIGNGVGEEDEELRYMPNTPATLCVEFHNLDGCLCRHRQATQPFPQDTSIWAVPIMTHDVLQFNSINATLTEGNRPSQVITHLVPMGKVTSRDTDNRRLYD